MRNLKTVIYGSSYDRGLEHLLKIWPDVRKEVPDAELRIFYGWEMFDRVMGNNPERMAWREKINKLMEQPGVTHLGRISHEACIKENENAAIWAYPTHFGEISCITAMRAQVYGAIPVVIDYAALQETVQWGSKIEGDIYEPETRELFKAHLIEWLKRDPKQVERDRQKMMEWAREKFTWSAVAKQWSDEFKSTSLERQIDELMDDNQALKAWDLVKDTDSPLKEKVYAKVKHAFEPEAYKNFYTENLVESPFDETQALNIDQVIPRYAWMVPKILARKPKSLIDLGCADGALCLTLASKGIACNGINLYKPSVDFANERAKKNRLPASFLDVDLFKLPPGEGSDVVVMTEVLEHLPDPQKGVDHVMSLLNKQGHAFFSTPRTDHLGVEQHKAEAGRKKWSDDDSPAGHLRLFTEEEFKDLFKKYKIVDYYLDEERCMNVEVSYE